MGKNLSSVGILILMIILSHVLVGHNTTGVTSRNQKHRKTRSQDEEDPHGTEVDFEKSIHSLSVVEGKDAVMRCTVRNLGDHEVSWIFVDKQLQLSKQELVKNPELTPRVKIIRDNNTFTLMIHQVILDDSGYYACRINSHPPKSQVGFLEVVVPPSFQNSSLASDTIVTVREYENVTLTCRATANPPPVVRWKREDGQAIRVLTNDHSSKKDVMDYEGDELFLHETTRWSTGAFICSVTSGVSSPISRRVMLLVTFPPMIIIPSSAIASGVGQNVSLECITESFPLADQEWYSPKGQRIFPSSSKKSTSSQVKYVLREKKTFSFKVIYRLTIIQVSLNDSGSYTCLIKNALGSTKSSLTLQVVDSWSQKQITSSFGSSSSSGSPFMTPGITFSGSNIISSTQATLMHEFNSNITYYYDKRNNSSSGGHHGVTDGHQTSGSGLHASGSGISGLNNRKVITHDNQTINIILRSKNYHEESWDHVVSSSGSNRYATRGGNRTSSPVDNQNMKKSQLITWNFLSGSNHSSSPYIVWFKFLFVTTLCNIFFSFQNSQ